MNHNNTALRPDLGTLKTEGRNQNTLHIDEMTTIEMVTVMNNENRVVEDALATQLQEIAAAVDLIAASLSAGGHLIYIGAGTSGRLGVVDASECPPTFGVDYETVQGIIAGGKERMFKAGENAEDVYENGVKDVENVLKAGDVLVEYDKLIDQQLERAAITSISGFAKICDDAACVLNV